MLNGKFFTGLPPKMIDKGAASRNRLESHFFWPDDSQVESAVETRVRRRNSLQVQDYNKPVYDKQLSVGGGNDVDTKRRFSKEFSQSSIQFYDNLNDNNTPSTRRQFRSSVGAKKLGLTEKPTATKLELPESVVDEAYTTAKKKQAYTSKIQFYDFVNEEDNNARTNRNNLRKPKMDMNDKREMELNAKNSPKLQVKRDVRSLSEEKEMPKLNNREVKTTTDRSRPIKEINVNRSHAKRENEREDIYGRSNVSPKRSFGSARNNYERDNYREAARNDEVEERPRYGRDREVYQKSNHSVLTKAREHQNFDREPEVGEDRRGYSTRTYDNAEQMVEEPQYRRVKNDTRGSGRSQHESPEYHNDYEDEIGGRMKTVRIQASPPRRHHYYREEYYEDEEPEHYDRAAQSTSTGQTKRGNYQRHSDYSAANVDDDRYADVDLPFEEKIEVIHNNSKAHINRVTNKLNNESHKRTGSSPSAGLSTYRATTAKNSSSTPRGAATEPIDVNKPQKHLRSSLCFNDGAIVAENDATRSPTSQKPTTRRNIRSTATKRVSVGLPD